MLKPISLFLMFGFLLIPIQSLKAQNSLFKIIEVGASLNYSTLHYEDEGDALNDIISYDFGIQVHALANIDLANNFRLQTGLEYFFFTYEIESQRIPINDINGEPTGDYAKGFIAESFNTSYLTVPIRLQFHPFDYYQFYITAGPEFSYKIGYSNGMYKQIRYSENDEKLQEYSVPYDVPESANDFLISGVAGIGYNLNTVVPVKLELKAKHSLTPYLSGDNYTKSWIRSLSFSISYNL